MHVTVAASVTGSHVVHSWLGTLGHSCCGLLHQEVEDER